MKIGSRLCSIKFKAVVFVMLAAVLPVLGDDAGPRTDLPAGVSADWWSQVQRSIQLEGYGIVAADGEGAAFSAANPAHRFKARFDGRGLRLASSEASGWEWGLSLTGWGRPESLEAARVLGSRADQDRVEFDRGPLTEWFVNSPSGLEHGFTVAVRPRGAGEQLVFDLALAGGLRPVFAEDGQSIDFYGGGNVSVLRYAKLLVTDASGSAVPARMEPIAGGVRIVVDDGNAVYPLTIDPLATSTSWTAVGEGTSHFFAYSVATAGDVNGDGYSDVVVGAYGSASNTGKAYLYLGGASGLSATASWTAVGEGTSHYFAHSVATAGDVNGDGYSDVVVGAYGSGSNTGKAYLYRGGASGLSATASWTAVGEGTGHFFAYSVATAGDVNGDGYSDVVVGSYGSATNTGKAYLYLGGASGLSATASWTTVGEGTNNSFGWSVATAGDVDGDGYSDVVVGASGNAGSRGKAYLYLGGASGLSAAASWTAVGEGANSEFGWSVATAGDVDGDDFADVVIGARGNAGLTGKAYLYRGGVSGLSATASWTATGEGVNNSFGRSVATAGDIDGDGYADVIIGADGNGSSTGKAYLYRGGASGLSAAASWTAVGEGANSEFGWSVATAGDVNGDGHSDVVIGAPRHGASSQGKAYLYLGGAGGLSAAAPWTAVGEARRDFFGESVATAGDVNGDGYADVLVGATDYGDRNEGKVYLYLGGASGLLATPSWTAVGEGQTYKFGSRVATAGDVNGDGYDDVVIGAPGFDRSRGKAYLYLGTASGLMASPSWTAEGEGTGLRSYGASVATAGDVNGDGYADVVIGSPDFDYVFNLGSKGKVYVYLGGASGLSATASWTALGTADRLGIGLSVATAGDVNGDGYSDLLVGAWGNETYREPGRAYLYLGGAAGLSATASWTALGETAGDHSVATAGDVNGDGYSDVLFGESDYPDRTTDRTGRALLYLGGASGLSATASWTAVGEALNDEFGRCAVSAGDVNGDGYSDVVVGAEGNVNYTGKAYFYLGGASGLSAAASWTAVGEEASGGFGRSLATAGDVNGDGRPDVVIGASIYGNDDNGKAYLYLGGSERGGVAVVPRQMLANLSAPISLGGAAYEQQFRLGLTLQSPAGRVSRKLQWQVVPWGGDFSPAVNPIQSETSWFDATEARTVPVSLLGNHQRYVWRARARYRPTNSPFVPWGPWFTMTGNGLRETDLFSTSATTPCRPPTGVLYISAVTLDAKRPVLTYQDPNPPGAVTGYNIYRASVPTGPWTKLASNIGDMDAGSPGVQYLDATGDVGSLWYYQVAAYNAACAAEGPW